eukprot:TRINITY_DN4744_c0_g1_i2.p1 TRINITY_DN4744_c0_g1~~TRINITY_DN4744_c0_g1_i2.p1  ORF type:complete len:508 (+),score=77.98 TRINITY_DN4744_c0_g1_i2:57-1580(+)
MLQNQSALKSLPVPSLEETIEKYLLSVKAIVSPQQYERTKSVAAEFVKQGGIGRQLHAELCNRAASMKNWLEDWWLTYAYLAYPDPIPINSNWEMMFDQDSKDEIPQARQAARLLTGLLLYAPILLEEKLEPEYMRGKVPLCMSQYTKPFTTCRFPGNPSDRIETVTPGNFVIVISKNRFYKLEISGLHKSSDLELAFDHILKDSDSKPYIPYSPGLFTAGDRHVWAAQRQKLLDSNNCNGVLFDAIAKSLGVFILDHDSPSTSDQLAWSLLAGKNASSRWFDKIFQIIIFKNGRCGMNGEHSPADGIAMARVADFLAGRIRSLGPQDVDPFDSSAMSFVPVKNPVELSYHISPEVEAALKESQRLWHDFSTDLELRFFCYDRYGGRLMKDTLKLSPDSFVQMALQLAYRKAHNKVCPVYETGQTRQFFHGRTETVRSLSVESVEFTRLMLSEGVSSKSKFDALKAAVAAHQRYMNEAVNGKGCDRHLLGLRLLGAASGLECGIVDN